MFYIPFKILTLSSSNPNNNVYATSGGDLNLTYTYILNENFDSMTVGNTPTGWTVSEAGGTVRVSDDAVSPPSTSNTLKFVDSNSGASIYGYRTFTEQTQFAMQYSVRIAAGDWANIMITNLSLYTTGASPPYYASQLYFQTDNNIYSILRIFLNSRFIFHHTSPYF